MRTLPNGDVMVGPAEVEHVAGDFMVDGWLDVKGALTCDGDVRALGISVEPGGTLRCRAITTNVLEVDNVGSRTRVVAAAITARLAKLVQVGAMFESTKPLADLLSSDRAHVDYTHEFGGDLNPSFDRERGARQVLRADVLEARDGDEDGLPIVSMFDIRRELTSGGNPFEGVAPLVTKSPPPVRKPREEVDDPLLTELRTWLAGHEGPQRKLVDDLAATWVARLAAAPAAVRDAGARIVKAAIKSPKLAAERDAMLAKIAGAAG